MAGVRLLPMLAACALGSFVAGALSKNSNITSLTLILGSALQLAGIGLLSSISPRPDVDAITFQALMKKDFFLLDAGRGGNTATGENLPLPTKLAPNGRSWHFVEPLDVAETPDVQYFFQFLFGLGVGLSLAAATMITSVKASKADHASAHGALAQVRVLGGAIGILTCATILDDRLVAYVVPTLPSNAAATFLQNPIGSLPTLDTAAREWVKLVYASAFGEMITGMLYVTVACLVASLFAWERNPGGMAQANRSRHKMSSDGTGRGRSRSGGCSGGGDGGAPTSIAAGRGEDIDTGPNASQSEGARGQQKSGSNSEASAPYDHGRVGRHASRGQESLLPCSHNKSNNNNNSKPPPPPQQRGETPRRRWVPSLKSNDSFTPPQPHQQQANPRPSTRGGGATTTTTTTTSPQPPQTSGPPTNNSSRTSIGLHFSREDLPPTLGTSIPAGSIEMDDLSSACSCREQEAEPVRDQCY